MTVTDVYIRTRGVPGANHALMHAFRVHRISSRAGITLSVLSEGLPRA